MSLEDLELFQVYNVHLMDRDSDQPSFILAINRKYEPAYSAACLKFLVEKQLLSERETKLYEVTSMYTSIELPTKFDIVKLKIELDPIEEE